MRDGGRSCWGSQALALWVDPFGCLLGSPFVAADHPSAAAHPSSADPSWGLDLLPFVARRPSAAALICSGHARTAWLRCQWASLSFRARKIEVFFFLINKKTK